MHRFNRKTDFKKKKNSYKSLPLKKRVSNRAELNTALTGDDKRQAIENRRSAAGNTSRLVDRRARSASNSKIAFVRVGKSFSVHPLLLPLLTRFLSRLSVFPLARVQSTIVPTSEVPLCFFTPPSRQPRAIAVYYYFDRNRMIKYVSASTALSLSLGHWLAGGKRKTSAPD